MRTSLKLALTLAAVTTLAAPATPQTTDYLHANATTGVEACPIFGAWFADHWLGGYFFECSDALVRQGNAS